MNSEKPVSNLTAGRRDCHKVDTRRRPYIGIVGIALLLLFARTEGSQWHDPKDIAATAEDYLQARLDALSSGRDTPAAGDERLLAAKLDPRLKLVACDQPLAGFVRTGTKLTARTIVGVRCSGSKPWKVYVPVEMTVNMTVWVASKALPRGHILTDDDMVADIRNVSHQSTGYFSVEQTLAGQRLRTSVLAGRAFEPAFVEADNAIRRGQSVTLAVRGNGIAVRMSGTALGDGAINQRIRVENHNSGRVVEGIVRSRELVEILVPGPGRFAEISPKVAGESADTVISNNESATTTAGN